MDRRFGLGLRFFLIPVTVMLNSGSPGWLDEETSAGWSPNLNMIFLLMNEVMVCRLVRVCRLNCLN